MITNYEFVAKVRQIQELCGMDAYQVRQRQSATENNHFTSVYAWGQCGMPFHQKGPSDSPTYVIVSQTPVAGMAAPLANEHSDKYMIRYEEDIHGRTATALRALAEFCEPGYQCFGFDCTGLVQAAMYGWAGYRPQNEFDYLAACDFTRVSRDSAEDMAKTRCGIQNASPSYMSTFGDFSTMRPGSIVFSYSGPAGTIRHVGIYMGGYPGEGPLHNRGWIVEAADPFVSGMVNGVQQVFVTDTFYISEKGLVTAPPKADGTLNEASNTVRYWQFVGQHVDIVYTQEEEYLPQVENLQFDASTNTATWDAVIDATRYEIRKTDRNGLITYAQASGTSYTYDHDIPMETLAVHAIKDRSSGGSIYSSKWSVPVTPGKVTDPKNPTFSWSDGIMRWMESPNANRYTVRKIASPIVTKTVYNAQCQLQSVFGTIAPGDRFQYRGLGDKKDYPSNWSEIIVLPSIPVDPVAPPKVEKSRIILYSKDERDFISYGECDLSDAIECKTKEVRNGEFLLEMSYPAIGEKSKLLKKHKIIFCKPNPYDDPEPFRIVSIKKYSKGKKTIKAYHISYDLGGWICRPPESAYDREITYDEFVERISGNISGAIIETTSPDPSYKNGKYPFEFVSLIDKSSPFYTEMTRTNLQFGAPTNVRSLICDSTSGVINLWKGELRFKRWKIYHYENRGTAANFVLRYRKNIQNLETTEDATVSYEGVVPFCSYQYQNASGEQEARIEWIHTTPPVIPVDSSVSVDAIDFSRLYLLDLTDEVVENEAGFKDSKGHVLDSWFQEKTEKFMQKNNFKERLYSGGQSFEVDMQQLNVENSEYADYRALESVRLCDTIWVYYPDLDVKSMKKVVETEYDVLRNRYTKLKLTEGIEVTSGPSDGYSKNSMSDTSNVTLSDVQRLISESKASGAIVSGYLYNGIFYEDAQYANPLAAESTKLYVDKSTYSLYNYNANTLEFRLLGGTGTISIIFGYYNSVTGKFYKESTYATEITGKVDVLYIDKATRAQYLFDGTTFMKSSGTDVYFGYYNETDGKFYKEATFTTELPRLVNSAIYVDITSNTSYRLNLNEAFVKIGATSLVFAYKNGNNWYSDSAHTTQIQTNKTTLYIDIHTRKAMIDIGTGSTTVFDRILAKVPLQQDDFLMYDDDTEALKLLYTSALKKTAVVNPDDPEDILYKLDLNVLSNGGLVVASDGLKVEWDKLPLDSTSLQFTGQTPVLGVKLKSNAGLLATADGLDVNWNRIDWTAFPHDAESIGYDEDAAGYYVEWGGLPTDGTLQWANNKLGVKLKPNAGLLTTATGLDVNWDRIDWTKFPYDPDSIGYDEDASGYYVEWSGLPIDGTTIFWDNNVLKAAGGGGRTYHSGSGIDVDNGNGSISVNLLSEGSYLTFVDNNTCLDVNISALSNVFATATHNHDGTYLKSVPWEYFPAGETLTYDEDVGWEVNETKLLDYFAPASLTDTVNGLSDDVSTLSTTVGNHTTRISSLANDVTTLGTNIENLATDVSENYSKKTHNHDGTYLKSVPWEDFPNGETLVYDDDIGWEVDWSTLPIDSATLEWNQGGYLKVKSFMVSAGDGIIIDPGNVISINLMGDGGLHIEAGLLDVDWTVLNDTYAAKNHNHNSVYPQFTSVEIDDRREDAGDQFSLNIVNGKLVLTITDP